MAKAAKSHNYTAAETRPALCLEMLNVLTNHGMRKQRLATRFIRPTTDTPSTEGARAGRT